MNEKSLRDFYERKIEDVLADPHRHEIHEALLTALESGHLRAAEPDGDDWRVNTWVKQAILAGFRMTDIEEMPGPGFSFFDKTAYPARALRLEDGIRLVPGGCANSCGHACRGWTRPSTACLPTAGPAMSGSWRIV